MRAHLRYHVPPLTILLLLWCIVIWPAPFAIEPGAYIGEFGDTAHFMWNFWWMGRVIADGEPLFHTDWLGGPEGLRLTLHTLTPLKSVPGWLLTPWLGVTGAYNLLMSLTFLAASLSMYALAWCIVGSRIGAVAAGVTYSYSAFHLARALGHLNIVSIEFLPLILLSFCMLRESMSYRKVAVRGVLGGVALGLTLLCSYYLAVVGGVLVGVIAAVGDEPWRKSGAWLGGVIIGTAMSCGWWLAAIFAQLRAHGSPEIAGGTEHFGLDLFALLLPNPYSHFTGWVTRAFLEATPWYWYDHCERVGSIGIVGLFALVLGWRGLGQRRLVAALLVTGVTLSLGRSLQLLGWETGLPLPFLVLQELPFLADFRVPARLQVLTLLAVSLLTASMTARLWESGGKRKMLVVVLASIGLLEHNFVSMPTEVLDVPEIFTPTPELATEQRAIILPGRDRFNVMLWQMTAEQRFTAGWVSRIYADDRAQQEELWSNISRQLSLGPQDIIPADEALHGLLASYDINLIYLDRGRWEYFELPPEIREPMLEALLPDPPVLERGRFRLYRRSQITAAATLSLGQGLEVPLNGIRGLNGKAELLVVCHRPGHFRIEVVAQPIASLWIAGAEPQPDGSVVVELTPGRHRLSIEGTGIITSARITALK